MGERYKAFEQTNKYLENQRNRVLLGMDKQPEYLWDEANNIANVEFGDDYITTVELLGLYTQAAVACGCRLCEWQRTQYREEVLQNWHKPFEEHEVLK